MNTMVSHL